MPNSVNERYNVIAEFIAGVVEEQSFYRRNANTINGTIAATIGAIVWVAQYLLTTGQAPELYQILSALVIPVLTAISLKLTRNGIGAKTSEALKKPAAEAALRQTALEEAQNKRQDKANKQAADLLSIREQFSRY